MKAKKNKSNEPMVLHDMNPSYMGSIAENTMLRTQIYLTRAEHEFLQQEAGRRGEAMSSVIRGIIDEKMAIPGDAWEDNPMFEATPDVEGWSGHEDGAINHDHYIYGSAKNYEKRNGEWVLLPPTD